MTFTPERQAELVASARAKQAAAIRGFYASYELSIDEYRALFEAEPSSDEGLLAGEYWLDEHKPIP